MQSTGVVIAVAMGLALPAGAGAATEVGQLQPASELSQCEGDAHFLQLATTAGASFVIPAGGGVISGWRHRGRAGASGSARLQVWRPAGGSTFTLVGRSDLEQIAPAVVNQFPTRIPVTGGELLGMRIVGEDVGCVALGFPPADAITGETADDDPPDPQPGQSRTMTATVGTARLNIVAIVEPDADGDEFGDETQDVVPGLQLDEGLRVKRSGFPVAVSCGVLPCEVELGGRVAVRRAGRGAAASRSKRFKLKRATISVGPGAEVRTRLKLKRKRRSTRKLRAGLKRKRAVAKLVLTFSATNTLGADGETKEAASLKR